MSAEIVDRVLRSSRYRDVDRSLLKRLAAEELPRSRNADDAVKRVKRRLHQAVGAFRGTDRRDRLAAAWRGDLSDPAFRAAVADALRAHASTRERLPYLGAFYSGIWARTGVPRRLLDLGCGLDPLALPWMGIGAAEVLAVDVDRRSLARVRSFLDLVGQPHQARVADLVTTVPDHRVDVALALKLVTTLDRQEPGAATRLLRGLQARYAVVSFTTRTLGGRGRGLERTYRDRLERLVADSGRVLEVAEASVPNELVFVLELEPIDG